MRSIVFDLRYITNFLVSVLSALMLKTVWTIQMEDNLQDPVVTSVSMSVRRISRTMGSVEMRNNKTEARFRRRSMYREL